ncbi:hypothetical protein BDV41DRAFT_516520 [Aspergillus transmontanensis]|uniref:EF-hand domain-containing protein n=1 Tax=Aspergillus transmontanensis TaxID=1034304 RepID=A0A5N6WGP9_9EURO|nr:hypothetical protein BDV41DRAFT_516520 [Aspergillus transmontanensis]
MPNYGGKEYTDEEVKEWQDLFDKINTGKKKDNILDEDEYLEFRESQGLEVDYGEFEQIFKEMDKNGDGQVTFDEFINTFGKASQKK